MPVMVNRTEWLTTNECAAFLGVKQRRVLQFIEEGRLKATKIGRPWFVKRSHLEKFDTIERKPGNLTGKPRKSKKKKKVKAPAK